MGSGWGAFGRLFCRAKDGLVDHGFWLCAYINLRATACQRSFSYCQHRANDKPRVAEVDPANGLVL
jgi:hypothetical protein